MKTLELSGNGTRHLQVGHVPQWPTPPWQQASDGASAKQRRPCVTSGFGEMGRIPVLGAEQQLSEAGLNLVPLHVVWEDAEKFRKLLWRATAGSQYNS